MYRTRGTRTDLEDTEVMRQATVPEIRKHDMMNVGEDLEQILDQNRITYDADYSM